jgi:HSP20 family protein
MGSISVRKQNGDKPAVATPSPTPSVWDPWRRMRALLDWDPFAEMAPLSAALEPAASFNAAFDIKETRDAYLFKADVPGVPEKDLEVTVTGNRLTIGGKREEEKEEKSDRYYTYERSYGSFSRSFTLPDGADTDRLQANLEKGVLTVSIPKKPEVQPKKITVSSESSPKS